MSTRLYKRRISYILFTLLSLTVAGALVLKAFRENLLFYFVPSDIRAGKAPMNHPFRLGGLVEKGSVRKDGLTVYFTITDMHEKIPVTYTGILPDLFREGHGVIVRGRMNDPKLFTAEEVLAKHDEKYAPR
ncbi:MAG: cytochrome c maturation protein CcmE [Pseudomonadota bacterium]